METEESSAFVWTLLALARLRSHVPVVLHPDARYIRTTIDNSYRTTADTAMISFLFPS